MSKSFEYLLIGTFVAILLVVSRWIGHLAYAWMPVQATAEAQRVDDLFSFLTSIGAFIFLGLVGAIAFSIFFFRAPHGDFSEGHPARSDVRLEILWMVVPGILVLWIAFQSFNIYQQLNILGLKQIVHLHTPLEAEPANAALISDIPKPAAETIEVFAKQWVWSFRYPNNVTSNELHLPINRSTRLNLHAQSVIHGFYVPEFRLKQDIVPGREIDLVLLPTRAGKYRLRDSQFSGTDFASMEADVYIESLQAYSDWLTRIAVQKPDSTIKVADESKTLFKSGYIGIETGEWGKGKG